MHRQHQQQRRQPPPPEPQPPSPAAAAGRTNLTKEQHLPFINPTASQLTGWPLSEICSFVDVQKSGKEKKCHQNHQNHNDQWIISHKISRA